MEKNRKFKLLALMIFCMFMATCNSYSPSIDSDRSLSFSSWKNKGLDRGQKLILSKKLRTYFDNLEYYYENNDYDEFNRTSLELVIFSKSIPVPFIVNGHKLFIKKLEKNGPGPYMSFLLDYIFRLSKIPNEETQLLLNDIRKSYKKAIEHSYNSKRYVHLGDDENFYRLSESFALPLGTTILSSLGSTRLAKYPTHWDDMFSLEYLTKSCGSCKGVTTNEGNFAYGDLNFPINLGGRPLFNKFQVFDSIASPQDSLIINPCIIINRAATDDVYLGNLSSIVFCQSESSNNQAEDSGGYISLTGTECLSKLSTPGETAFLSAIKSVNDIEEGIRCFTSSNPRSGLLGVGAGIGTGYIAGELLNRVRNHYNSTNINGQTFSVNPSNVSCPLFGFGSICSGSDILQNGGVFSYDYNRENGVSHWYGSANGFVNGQLTQNVPFDIYDFDLSSNDYGDITGRIDYNDTGFSVGYSSDDFGLSYVFEENDDGWTETWKFINDDGETYSKSREIKNGEVGAWTEDENNTLDEEPEAMNDTVMNRIADEAREEYEKKKSEDEIQPNPEEFCQLNQTNPEDYIDVYWDEIINPNENESPEDFLGLQAVHDCLNQQTETGVCFSQIMCPIEQACACNPQQTYSALQQEIFNIRDCTATITCPEGSVPIPGTCVCNINQLSSGNKEELIVPANIVIRTQQ